MTLAHLVERIPEWQLSVADEAGIASLLARCFDTDFGGRSYFSQHHHLRLVIREGGQIIGHMALVLRSVDLDDTRVSVAGLAEVATDPDHRGKGIAATLLAAAIAEAAASPAQYLLLFGEAKVYAAAGFRAVTNRMAQVVFKGTRAARVVGHGDDALMVLPLRGQTWPDAALLDLRGQAF